MQLSGKLMTDLNLCSKGSLEIKVSREIPWDMGNGANQSQREVGPRSEGFRLCLLGQEGNPQLLSHLGHPSSPQKPPRGAVLQQSVQLRRCQEGMQRVGAGAGIFCIPSFVWESQTNPNPSMDPAGSALVLPQHCCPWHRGDK